MRSGLDLQRLRALAKNDKQPTGIPIVKKITLPSTETGMHTKDKLAAALREIGQEALATMAEAGKYDDYLSDSATPQMDLCDKLAHVGSVEALALRRRVIDGDFDATAEESDAWAKSPEGQAAFKSLIKGK